MNSKAVDWSPDSSFVSLPLYLGFSHPILVSTQNFNFRVYLVKKKSVFRKVISNLFAFIMVTDSFEILSRIVVLLVI